jgi:hypothetical protein
LNSVFDVKYLKLLRNGNIINKPITKLKTNTFGRFSVFENDNKIGIYIAAALNRGIEVGKAIIKVKTPKIKSIILLAPNLYATNKIIAAIGLKKLPIINVAD